MTWPSDIPADLARDLAELDAWRAPASDADRWNVIKAWLQRHQVAAPEGLPRRAEILGVHAKFD